MGGKPCPRYLFEDLDTLSYRLANSRRIFLFLDYDGTISPIPRRRIELERPLSSYLRKLLRRLSSPGRVVVSIVSGRSVDVLRRLVGIESIYYAGVHGHVVVGPGVRFTHCVAESLSDMVRSVMSEIAGEITALGAVVEDKGVSFTIHHRGVRKDSVETIRRLLYDISERYPGIVVRRGKSMFEVLPNTGWDKGMAVAYMISLFSIAGGPGLSIYMGDDYTDEMGFRAVNIANGISVRVGWRCRTNARYYAKDVGDVKKFLGLLEDLVREDLAEKAG